MPPLRAHTTLIIAVAAGAAAVLILIIILYRVFHRPVPQVPLPPKQELAHHREHRARVAAESRPTTWYDAGRLSAPPSAFGGSRSSLVPPESRGGSPFRRASLNTSETPSDDTFQFEGVAPMAPAMQLPHLSFDTSSSSLPSTTDVDSPSSFSPHLVSASNSSSPTASHQSRSPSSSSSWPYRRPRPLSVGSVGSSAQSRNSRHTIRGVPHGPHSQIDIVLPAPLATLASNDRMSIHESSNTRYSLVDQWAPPVVRSEGNPIPRSSRRPHSSSEPRRAISQSNLSLPPINAPEPRRPASSSISSRPYATAGSVPPPVPQIPQQWLPPAGSVDPPLRGRSRDIPSGDERASPAPSRASSSAGKLQKRSRSRGR